MDRGALTVEPTAVPVLVARFQLTCHGSKNGTKARDHLTSLQHEPDVAYLVVGLWG
jgi:hypothetical protein